MAFSAALADLEAAVLEGCAGQKEWPARVAAGVYAGVDYAIAHPEIGTALVSDSRPGSDTVRRYEGLIARLTGFLWGSAPPVRRLSGTSDETLVAGIVGLVGDHLRIGRVERLAELRPDLVLLLLLPYLGFDEAQHWADEADGSTTPA
jgi:hypothetical protein